jgi:hypothetical protein
LLRIHFTAEDLARTRVGSTVGAAAETYHSLEMLRCRSGGPPFEGWRAAVAREPVGDLRPLLALAPTYGPGMDLFTITGGAVSIDEAAENLVRLSPQRMLREFDHVVLPPEHQAWRRRFVAGEREAREQVAAALKAVHRVAVAPFWERAASHLDSVRADLGRTVLDGGIERVLEHLCAPLVRWRSPVLEIDYPKNADVHLGGRGLVILPVVFAWREVSLLFDPFDETAPASLTVPSLRDDRSAGRALWHGAAPSGQALGALLGRTRAAALRATVGGCNTTELARRLGVTPAAASQHATVLRNARLITTNRHGGAVLHTITPLGIDLLADRV